MRDIASEFVYACEERAGFLGFVFAMLLFAALATPLFIGTVYILGAAVYWLLGVPHPC